MKKEISIHLFSYLLFFFIVTLLQGWFTLEIIPFWIGGLVGSLLPDVDYLIYIYYLRPHELTSQRATAMLTRGEVWKSFNLLSATRRERTKLIFHTSWFQIVFLVLTFWVVTSSGNWFGRGLVIAFSLHLLVDQLIDFSEIGSLQNWFKDVKVELDKEKSLFYCLAILIIISILALLL